MNVDNFVPFECPVCLTLMKDARDVFSFFSSGCCGECKEEYLIPKGIKNIADAKISKGTKLMFRKKRKNLPSYILR
jgi:hypothetical protein